MLGILEMVRKGFEVVLNGFSSNQLYEYFREVIAFYHEAKGTAFGSADEKKAA